MDFDLSDDQLALRDAAAAVVADHAAPGRVRAVVDAGGGYDHELWAALVDQGWLGVEQAEGDGGLGLGFVEVAVLLEVLGAAVAPAPVASTLLALGALRGTPWEDRLAAGAIGCVAWAGSGPGVGAGAAGGAGALVGPDDGVGAGANDGTGHGAAMGAGAGARAGADGGAGALVGAGAGARGGGRTLVPYAPVADVAVVADAEGLAVHDLTDGGGRPRAEPAMDRTRCVGWIDADRPGATRVGGPAEAARLLDRGATAAAAEALGAAARVLDMTVEHAKTRVQFGKPIGSFQAVKHRCADMLVDVEGMRSTAYHAAWSLAADDPGASVAASTAKAWSGDASRRVMASGLQVHGGIGFTWEHDLHLYLKRAQLDGVSFGDPAFHRTRIAALLRPLVEAGESVI